MGKWIAEFDLEDGDIMPEQMDLEYKGARIDFHCRPLEQEPCEDCIPRDYVITLLEDKKRTRKEITNRIYEYVQGVSK